MSRPETLEQELDRHLGRTVDRSSIYDIHENSPERMKSLSHGKETFTKASLKSKNASAEFKAKVNAHNRELKAAGARATDQKGTPAASFEDQTYKAGAYSSAKAGRKSSPMTGERYSAGKKKASKSRGPARLWIYILLILIWAFGGIMENPNVMRRSRFLRRIYFLSLEYPSLRIIIPCIVVVLVAGLVVSLGKKAANRRK